MILEKLFLFTIFVTSIILITGGWIYQAPGVMIDLAKLQIFGSLISILGYFLLRQKSKTFQGVCNYTHNKLIEYSKRWVLLLLALSGLLLVARFLRHYTLFTDSYDVNFIHQPLFYPFSPTWLHCDACRVGSYFGEHSTFTLMLVAPLSYLFQSDGFLFFLKFMFVVGGIALLVRKGPLRSPLLLIGTALVLCSTALRTSMVWDFREDDLGFFFLCWALVSIYNRNLFWAFVAGLLASFTKENYALTVAILAVPIYFDRDLNISNQKRWAILWGLSFCAILILNLIVVIPFLNGAAESQNNVLIRFPGLGNSFREALVNFAITPAFWWKYFFSKFFDLDAIRYVVILLCPFVWSLTSKRSLFWLAPALPGIMMNILSSLHNQRMMIFHYDLIALPFLIFALFLALQKMRPTKESSFFIFAIALIGFGYSPVYEVTRYLPHVGRIPSVIKLHELRTNEPVIADSKTLAHLNHLVATRWMKIPEGAFSWPSFLELNPPMAWIDQGRDIGDAKILILNRLNESEVQMEESLTGLYQSKVDWGLFTKLEFDKPLLSVVCEHFSACR